MSDPVTMQQTTNYKFNTPSEQNYRSPIPFSENWVKADELIKQHETYIDSLKTELINLDGTPPQLTKVTEDNKQTGGSHWTGTGYFTTVTDCCKSCKVFDCDCLKTRYQVSERASELFDKIGRFNRFCLKAIDKDIPKCLGWTPYFVYQDQTYEFFWSDVRKCYETLIPSTKLKASDIVIQKDVETSEGTTLVTFESPYLRWVQAAPTRIKYGKLSNILCGEDLSKIPTTVSYGANSLLKVSPQAFDIVASATFNNITAVSNAIERGSGSMKVTETVTLDTVEFAKDIEHETVIALSAGADVEGELVYEYPSGKSVTSSYRDVFELGFDIKFNGTTKYLQINLEGDAEEPAAIFSIKPNGNIYQGVTSNASNKIASFRYDTSSWHHFRLVFSIKTEGDKKFVVLHAVHHNGQLCYTSSTAIEFPADLLINKVRFHVDKGAGDWCFLDNFFIANWDVTNDTYTSPIPYRSDLAKQLTSAYNQIESQKSKLSTSLYSGFTARASDINDVMDDYTSTISQVIVGTENAAQLENDVIAAANVTPETYHTIYVRNEQYARDSSGILQTEDVNSAKAIYTAVDDSTNPQHVSLSSSNFITQCMLWLVYDVACIGDISSDNESYINISRNTGADLPVEIVDTCFIGK